MGERGERGERQRQASRSHGSGRQGGAGVGRREDIGRAWQDDAIPKRHARAAWVVSALIIGTVAVDPFGFAPFGPIKWLLVTAGAFGALWLAIAAKLQVHRPSRWGWITFPLWGVVVSLPALDPVLGSGHQTVDRVFSLWRASPRPIWRLKVCASTM